MREPQWRLEGEEPDYRFSLANERTFLAWIRTALGLLAGGVLLDQFASTLGPPMVIKSFSVAFGLLAAALCAQAYRRWRGNEIAMRHARRLPGTPAIALLASATMGVAIGTALMLVMHG